MKLSVNIAAAIGFAAAAHIKQKRKYTGESYLNHCVSVMEIYGNNCRTPKESVLIACLLHDVIEDCGISAQEIEFSFGEIVAALVVEVSDVSKPEDGNRKVRKQLDLMHLSKCSVDGANIKLADLINNTESIIQHDRKFARIYIPEKRKILKVLGKINPDKKLFELACSTVAQAELLLGE